MHKERVNVIFSQESPLHADFSFAQIHYVDINACRMWNIQADLQQVFVALMFITC